MSKYRERHRRDARKDPAEVDGYCLRRIRMARNDERLTFTIMEALIFCF
jgi:hypothetical protein